MRYPLSATPFALLAALVVMGSLSSTTLADTETAEEQAANDSPIGLFDAEERGDVEIKFIARSDRAARIFLTNKTDRPLSLDLPEAFAGVPVLAQFGGGGGGLGGGGGGGFGGGGGGGQGVGGGLGGGGGGGLGGGGGQFSIPAEETEKIDVAVVCLDHGKKDPSSSKPYKMVPVDQYVSEPAVVELLKAFGRGETHHGATQAAVWAMNNGLSWSQLASKLTGTVRSSNRVPYFSRAELQAAVAYVQEATRRAAAAAEAEASEPSPGESGMAEEEDFDEDSSDEPAGDENSDGMESDDTGSDDAESDGVLEA